MSKPLHAVLRGIAGSDFAGLQAQQREAIRQAAAEIEGHNEAFAQVVADKCSAEAARRATERNLRGAYDLLAGWRDLLAGLQFAWPLMLHGDEWMVKIRKARAGEAYPAVTAAWRDHVVDVLSKAGLSTEADVIRRIDIDRPDMQSERAQ